MSDITISVEMRGPLFAAGVQAKVGRAVENSVQELMEKGDERLADLLRPRPAGVFRSEVYATAHGYKQTGHYASSIHPQRSGLVARIDDSRVVYGPWLEGTSSRNQTTRFKGYGSFRKTLQYLGDQAPATVQRHIGKLVRDLGG